ncbi:inactive poly [ADP-ribose] polymerase RCD1-like [Curcuma longa]|uniref:inactive poly [ADP-ribose] polymerase RCD1-like n=1 Tax=Curcuma longa TaxID=136217 RepID=UPI003D9F4BAE
MSTSGEGNNLPAELPLPPLGPTKRAAAPSRFLFPRNGCWTDFPLQVLDQLRRAFLAGKTSCRVQVGAASYFFDFRRMVQVDAESGAANPIAWIGVDGRCFFPISSCSDSGFEVRLDKSLSSSEEEDSSSTTVGLGQPRWPGTERLETKDRDYKVVANLFAAAGNASITSIHKCLYSSPARNSRMKAFQMQVEATRAARGHANVKFGWLPTTLTDLAVIVAHGFGRTNHELLGAAACGFGLHLSPPHSPLRSCVLSEVDDVDGEGHVVLCRAVMGNMEEVAAGSLRYHPSSSEEFDSAADDLASPNWYIVWSTHMNTHIIPEYIVSFRFSEQSQGTEGSRRRTMRSSSPKSSTVEISRMSFSKLFAEIVKSLPPSMKKALEITYSQYKGGNLSKEAFIRYLRSTVGDKLLTSSIRSVRGY